MQGYGCSNTQKLVDIYGEEVLQPTNHLLNTVADKNICVKETCRIQFELSELQKEKEEMTKFLERVNGDVIKLENLMTKKR